jgi:hypothetical protein
VLILKGLKTLCFDTLLQVLILKVLRASENWCQCETAKAPRKSISRGEKKRQRSSLALQFRA